MIGSSTDGWRRRDSAFFALMDFFARRKNTETDLPLPEGGVTRCYIVAADGDMEPIQFTGREALERVIREEFEAIGLCECEISAMLPDYVDYYMHD